MNRKQPYNFITLPDGSAGVEFGRYPQGKNGEVLPIIWRILERDEEHGKMLLITDKVIDNLKYHRVAAEVMWEYSDIRKWLNGRNSFSKSMFDPDEIKDYHASFFYNAFEPRERDSILFSKNTKNGYYCKHDFSYHQDDCKDATDRIFLLNAGEAGKYFGQGNLCITDKNFRVGFWTKDTAAACAVSTPFARLKNKNRQLFVEEADAYEYLEGDGIYVHDDIRDETFWWLRNSGSGEMHHASYVHWDGSMICTIGRAVDTGFIGIRPALWLKLDGGQN